MKNNRVKSCKNISASKLLSIEIKSAGEWVDDFVRQFNAIKSRLFKDYNAK